MPQWFVWTVLARAELRAIDRSEAKRILDGINRLRFGQGDIKPLVGTVPPTKRLRIGDYRIEYREAGKNRFEILRIGHRSDIYKR
jgi:mRNA-degrading endonuclease RelE of RelBE toxin-antitoxin system